MPITNYRFGNLSVDDDTFTSDVIIYPDRVRSHWWRKEGHRLDIADLQEIFDGQPKVLIVGTGYYGRMKVPDETRRLVADQGIEMTIASTPEAVELFNTMRASADIVAALHLTC